MGTRRELTPDEDLAPVVANHKTVFVEFHTELCAPCAVQQTFVDEVMDDLDGLVVTVDVEDHPEIASAHDLTTNPTLVVYENGDIVDRLDGLPERAVFREFVSPWC